MHVSYSINQLSAVVRDKVLPLFDSYSIITLTGSVGAGKTTLVKEFLSQAGVVGLVTSPTFAYVNSYQIPSGKSIHHFDLYRIDSLDSFLMNGFDEYLREETSLCIIEWPEVITQLLMGEGFKNRVCHISLQHDASDYTVRHLYISI
ncbi:tRNA (adenosine(37)-N6)-threonylcarbamoyltransferase complex ATPase subunit type 1 TsaE [Candidatus Dependentiae bacterium]|nr:tRNA (adenosine(37)-N6)-threonylcarbamoyltransferase complex ATPase subunit type 1 TsaE [Candidatus Dependentiae bacterium]